MNNSSSSSAGQSGKDPYEWLSWMQFGLFYFIGAGFFGTAMNLWLAISIGRNKKLRTRFYIIVCFLSATRVIVSFQYTFIGGYRMFRMLGWTSVNQYRIVCVLLYVGICYSATDILLLILLVVDRLTAILFPDYYRTSDNRLAVLAGTAVQTGSFLLHVLPLLVESDLMAVIPCQNAFSGATPWFSSFSDLEPLTFTILLLVLQLLAIVITWRRLRHLKRSTTIDNENRIFLKRQTALLKALRNMVFSHAGLTAGVRLFIMLSSRYPDLSANFVSCAGYVQVTDVVSGPLVLLFSKQDLRDACLPKCCRRSVADWKSTKASVKSVSIHPGPTQKTTE